MTTVILKKIEDKFKYIDVFKKCEQVKTMEKYKNDPFFVYFKENKKKNAVSLPIFEHIYN